VGGTAFFFQDQIKDALNGPAKPASGAATVTTTTKTTVTPVTPAAPAAASKPASSSSTPTPAAAPAPKRSEEKTPTTKEVEALEARIKNAEKGITKVNWNEVRKSIVDLLDDDNWDDGSWGPVFVRLAWHTSGTYDKNTKRGGSEGAAMRFAPESEWGANAGLAHARARLEKVKKEFPALSYADLWTFAGSVAIEEMGGPKINWRPGRRDFASLEVVALPDGLLPDADGRDKKTNPADHLRDIFYRMGFNDREIVALSGGHALGRCHEDRSGYWGPWTNAPTTFSNEYFRLLVEEKWNPKKNHKGGEWKGPAQFEDKTGTLMMLPTDLALVSDPKMRPIVEEYAKDEAKFFKDFAAAWTKLIELGVVEFHGRKKYLLFGPKIM